MGEQGIAWLDRGLKDLNHEGTMRLRGGFEMLYVHRSPSGSGVSKDEINQGQEEFSGSWRDFDLVGDPRSTTQGERKWEGKVCE